MTSTHADHEDLIRELTEETNAGNLAVIEELVAEDVRAGTIDGGLEDDPSPSGIREMEVAAREPFPDYHEELELVTTNGSSAVAIWTVTGTHEGEVYDVEPTGEAFETAIVREFEIEDGRITLWRHHWSPLSFLDEIGLDWDALKADLDDYVYR